MMIMIGIIAIPINVIDEIVGSDGVTFIYTRAVRYSSPVGVFLTNEYIPSSSSANMSILYGSTNTPGCEFLSSNSHLQFGMLHENLMFLVPVGITIS